MITTHGVVGTPPTTHTSKFNTGDLVKINPGATYYDGSNIPEWIMEENWYIATVSGNRVVLGKNEKGCCNIQSPIKINDVSMVNPRYINRLVKLHEGTKVYTNPGSGQVKGKVSATQTFTIVEEKQVNGNTYGKLKSGAGWVVIPSSTKNDATIKEGDKVKVINAILYGSSKPFKATESKYIVLAVSGDRVVISSNGKTTTAVVHKENLEKL